VIEVDIDQVASARHETRFERLIAGLLGSVALVAAILAVIQVDAGQQESRASALATRMSVEVSTGIAANTTRAAFGAETQLQALSLGMSAIGRQLTALQTTPADEQEQLRALPDQTASDRLLEIGAAMAAEPAEDSPLDPFTRRVLVVTLDELNALSLEQAAMVDLADRHSDRGGRAVLGLSLVALAGVLGGLAAVLGDNRAGKLALGAGGLALLAAIVAAVAAVV
jgi:hypothetical protein